VAEAAIMVSIVEKLERRYWLPIAAGVTILVIAAVLVQFTPHTRNRHLDHVSP
jgi:hypothetical protein